MPPSITSQTALDHGAPEDDMLEPIPHRFTDRVAERVRRTLHVPGAYLTIAAATRGQLQVSQSVVIDIARRAASTIPGVLAVSASLQDRSFRVELVLDYGLPALQVAAQARTQARRMVQACLGLQLTHIDVHVVDISSPADDSGKYFSRRPV